MRKGWIAAAALAAAGAGFLGWMAFAQTGTDVIVRRLGGMRVSAELYRQARGTMPDDFMKVVADGRLEAVPSLKLRGRLPCSGVRNYPSLEPRGSGCWGYVADPANPDFGSVFIDSGEKDPGGRYWTWF